MNTRDVVAARITELCEQKGMTLNELANQAGIPPTTVYSIFNLKSKNPGIVTLKKICDALEITLGAFFSTKEFDGLEQEIR
ncbi:MAG: helix-turn-helix transcriptional regulator [Oscillospiraceae bacterium]|nr:helix-turn-helix transcriptional regulator [Oscillospiraceae bacterium]